MGEDPAARAEEVADSGGGSGEAQEAEALAQEERLLAELEALRRELDEARGHALRLMADMENMRRRFAEQEARQRQDLTAELLRAILPAVDNLERAVRAAEGDEGPLATGVRMSLRTLEDGLARLGARRFDATGEQFDPARHEALAEAEAEDREPGTVIEVFVHGWLVNDQVVRPALVKVARS